MKTDLSHINEHFRAEDAKILDHYRHPELDLMMTASDWKDLQSILTKDERRAIRNYKSHLRGECRFYAGWLVGIEKAIAHINDYCWQQFNQRFAIYDQIQEMYLASMTGINPHWKGGKGEAIIPFWCKTTRKCLLFPKEWQGRIEGWCQFSNKKLGHRRFLVVKVDATKRLNFPRPE